MNNHSDDVLRVAEHFSQSPSFPEAVRRYAVGIAKFREGSFLVNKIVSTDTRWRLVGYILYLDADRERFGPEGGASYGRLLDICGPRGEAGPRLLRTVLALLTLTGFVRAERDRRDGRATLYRPTAEMDGFVREWLSYGIAALDVLEPNYGWVQAFAKDRQLIRRFLVSGGRNHVAGPPIAELMPAPLAAFTLHAGAFSVIWAVRLANDAGRPPPSRSEIARRYGLSKTQVTNVIAAGVKKGLFILDAAGGAAPTELLNASLERWIAIELAYYAIHMASAETSLTV